MFVLFRYVFIDLVVCLPFVIYLFMLLFLYVRID